MRAIRNWISANKKVLVTMTLCLCYATGLVWITMYTERVMSVCTKLRYLSYFLFILLACDTVINDIERYLLKCNEKNLFRGILKYAADHLFLCIWALMSVAVFIKTKHMQPAVFLCMILSMADTGFDKHIKAVFYVQICFMIMVLLLYNRGLIDPVNITRGEGNIRYSLGYMYPLELQGHFLYITLMYIYVRRKEFMYNDFLLINLANILLYQFTDAKTDFCAAVIVTVAALAVNIIGSERVIKHLHLWFWEGCALLSVVLPWILVLLYDHSNSRWVEFDRLLTWRLYCTNQVLKDTGIPLFGRIVEWVGLGYSNGGDLNGQTYYWIDSSFIKDAVDYGLVFSILLLLGFLFMIAYEFREKNVFGVIMLEGLLLAAMMEYKTFLPSVYPVILLMSSGILMTNKQQISCFFKKPKTQIENTVKKD